MILQIAVFLFAALAVDWALEEIYTYASEQFKRLTDTALFQLSVRLLKLIYKLVYFVSYTVCFIVRVLDWILYFLWNY